MHELFTLRVYFCEQTSWCLVFWVYVQQNTPAFLYGILGRYILFRPYKAAFRIAPVSYVDPSRLTVTELEYWGISGRKRLPLTKIEIIVATNPPDLNFAVALVEKQWMRFLIPPRVFIVLPKLRKVQRFCFSGVINSKTCQDIPLSSSTVRNPPTPIILRARRRSIRD